MKLKMIFTFVIVVLVLAVFYWLVSPLWKNTRVDEALPTSAISADKVDGKESTEPSQSDAPLTVTATGTFTGFDKLHNGSGTVKLISDGTRTYIRFESDFVVTNGPDLYVGLGKDGKYIASAEIAPLKGNLGSQNYLLPNTLSIPDYNEVWIWCKAFSVPFARAVLH